MVRSGTHEWMCALPVCERTEKAMLVLAIIGSAILLVVIAGAFGFLASPLNIQG
jgi:hypothetical protein